MSCRLIQTALCNFPTSSLSKECNKGSGTVNRDEGGLLALAHLRWSRVADCAVVLSIPVPKSKINQLSITITTSETSKNMLLIKCTGTIMTQNLKNYRLKMFQFCRSNKKDKSQCEVSMMPRHLYTFLSVGLSYDINLG